MKNKTLRYSIVSVSFASLVLMSYGCSKHNVAPGAPEDVPAAATDDVPQNLNLPALPDPSGATSDAAPVVTTDAPVVATADTPGTGDAQTMSPIVVDAVPSTSDEAPVPKKHRHRHRSSASVSQESAAVVSQAAPAATDPASEVHAEAPAPVATPVAAAPAAVPPPVVQPVAQAPVQAPPPVAQAAVPPPAPAQQPVSAPREPAQQKPEAEVEQPFYTKPGFLGVSALILAAGVGTIIMGRRRSKQS